jgi:hypothetical protein
LTKKAGDIIKGKFKEGELVEEFVQKMVFGNQGSQKSETQEPSNPEVKEEKVESDVEKSQQDSEK